MADAIPIKFAGRSDTFYGPGLTRLPLPSSGTTGEMVSIRCECGHKYYKANGAPTPCPACQKEN